MVEFRRATTADIIKIQQVAYMTWPATFGQVIAAEQLHYMLGKIYNETSLTEQMLYQRHVFMLAEKEDHTIEFTSYEINYHSQDQLMIHKLYILPEAQGSGIGTRFLDALSFIAREFGNRRLRLKVFHLNTNAIAFYEKYGFKKLGTETSNIGDNYTINDYVMVKDIHR